eukprot:1191150-Prorocentrum_minimum.AAC.7
MPLLGHACDEDATTRRRELAASMHQHRHDHGKSCCLVMCLNQSCGRLQVPSTETGDEDPGSDDDAMEEDDT